MADKIFPTDFTELTAFNDADKLPIQGNGAADMQYVEVKKLIDANTGLDSIEVGYAPIVGPSGKFESGFNVDNAITTSGASVDEIPVYSDDTQISPSGFKIKTITSWITSFVSGLFKANVNINSNTLVGRIGIDNGTRGVSLGLYNNGSAQEVAIHPSTSGAVSSTPQWLAKQSYVNDYVNQYSAVIAYVQLATTEALPAYTRVGNTITADANGALTVDGVAVLAGYKILVKDEVSDDENAVYYATQVGSGSLPFILDRDTSTDIVSLGAIGERFRPMIVSVSDSSTTNKGTWIKTSPYDERTHTYAKMS